jgi:hypothetical protein
VTWDEFKEEVEKAGVTGEMQISYIDISGVIFKGELNVSIDQDGVDFSVT